MYSNTSTAVIHGPGFSVCWRFCVCLCVCGKGVDLVADQMGVSPDIHEEKAKGKRSLQRQTVPLAMPWYKPYSRSGHLGSKRLQAASAENQDGAKMAAK